MSINFTQARAGLDYVNSTATHRTGDDECSAGWAGYGMLPLACFLYYLVHNNIKGKVLECGVFKGGSTCCLSHACDSLGLELIAADSFEGLPDSDDIYGKGDFKGPEDEVRRNVEAYGVPGAVTYLKGWYADSLKDFQDGLIVIWIDVDLKQSVLDVLDNTFDLLVPNGVIFADGLNPNTCFAQGQLAAGTAEAEGFIDFFKKRGISYRAVHTGLGNMGLIVPHANNDSDTLYDSRTMNRIIFLSLPFHLKIQVLRKLVRNTFRKGGLISLRTN